MMTTNIFRRAFLSTDIEEFLGLVFPRTWAPITARILESGVEFSPELCPWAPRWSRVSHTVRHGNNSDEDAVKSTIYRVHDCIHQLWGLPIPTSTYSEEDRYLFKRAGMCGEVAVLTLTEFVFCKHLYETYPELRELLRRRNAIPLMETSLAGKTPVQIAMRLDGLLHKKVRPKWVRDDSIATAFCDDYVPMLEGDRAGFDTNWQAMVDANWLPEGAPNSRYARDLDGLELTIWLVQDFYHQMNTDAQVDRALQAFNQARRRSIQLPPGWGATNT